MIIKTNGYLEEYREAIRKGEIIAGYEMIIELDHLLEEMKSDEYLYDTTKADLRMLFLENCVRLTKSPFYGQPMKLMLWQKAFISAAYSFKIKSIDTGEWVDRFTEVLLLISRKNAKTETVAALEFAELILGRAGSDIVCSGTNDNIADLCYQTVDTMRILVDTDNRDTWRNQKGIKCFANNNKIVKLSDSTRGKEGRNIDFCTIDEIHELQDDGIYKPIQQSTSTKPDFKIFMFSSEGFTNDGFLDSKLKEFRKILNGEDRSKSAKRKLPWLYTQDSEAEVWETNEQGINPAWQKSNPSIGVVKTWSYLRDRVDEARRSKADRMFVLSKDFNFKVSNSTAWLEKSDYDYDAPFDIEDFRGCYCLGAVDLSETTDMTNAKIMLCRRDDRRKYILSHFWIPESKLEESDDKNAGAKYQEWAQAGYITICEGNDNDLSLVADWFYSLQEKYGIRVLKCGYDQRFKRDWLNKMEYYGWVDKDDLIMINQSPDVLHTANNQVEADLKDRLIIGLNPVDKWCFGNAALKVDGRGKSLVVKIDNMKAKKIDGAVCGVILQETYNRYKTDLNDYLI
ncbi:MAG: terminase TerL endonuclease subunit [Candidatus Coproplasma sp.]